MKNLILAVLFCFGALFSTSVTADAAIHESNEVMPDITPIDYSYDVAIEVSAVSIIAYHADFSPPSSEVVAPPMVHFAHHSQGVLLRDLPVHTAANPIPALSHKYWLLYMPYLKGPPRTVQHKL